MAGTASDVRCENLAVTPAELNAAAQHLYNQLAALDDAYMEALSKEYGEEEGMPMQFRLEEQPPHIREIGARYDAIDEQWGKALREARKAEKAAR